MRVRAVRSISEFAADDEGLSQFMSVQLDAGLTRPDWWLVAEDEDERRIGRLGVRQQYTCDEPLRGDLPEHELFVFGVAAPWQSDAEPVLTSLAEASAGFGRICWRIGTYHDDAMAKAAAAHEVGFELFQEKVGFKWTDTGDAIPPPSLTYRTVEEIGDDSYASVLTKVIEGGVDREAAWYSARMPAGAWGKVMMEFCEPEDRESWLVAWDGDVLVGQVAITAFDPDYGDGTIAWVGVVPEQQGRGHGVELVRQAQRSARTRGFRSLMSDTDTLNVAMQRTFDRTGHVDADWHVWQFRWG